MTKAEEKPAISFTMRARVPADVLIQPLEGESVLLNLDTELYLGLNASGSTILKELTESDSVEDAYRALLARYEVDPERLRSELERFLRQLMEQGLVELHNP